MTFAERLKELREKAGLTQAALHEASGLSLSVIRDYEQGKREPTLRSAFRLADALRVDVNVFKDCEETDAKRPAGGGQAAAKKRTRQGRSGDRQPKPKE
jgi:transcriptional regulator with XRE-family HTH domain